MQLSIHTLRPARDIRPGDRIAMEPRKGAPQPDLVVDEVRHLGLDGSMDIYGRAPGVAAGQRRKLTAHAAAALRVIPSDEQAHQVWALLQQAVDAPAAGDAAALAHLDPDADRPGRSVWLGRDAELVVRLGREDWLLAPDLPELPELPTDGG